MAYQVNLGWTRNGVSPLFDWQYKAGGRPVGGGGNPAPGVGQAVYNAILDTATHFVDPAKTTNGVGTQVDPWQPTQAETLAVGGNVIVIEPGLLVGTDPGGNYVTESGFRPVNAGTLENPITFIARNAAVYSLGIGNTEIRSGATVQAAGWGAFGSNTTYVNYYGFYSDNNAANNKAFDDSGTTVFRLGADGCKVGWCDLRGQSGQSNNYSGVRIETSDQVEIFSSRMQGYVGNTNNSGIIIYKCNRTKIHNCEIFNCQHGIQPKGANSDGTNAIWGLEIYQNVIRACNEGLRFHGPVKGPSGELSLVYQNVFYGCVHVMEFTSSNTNIGEQDALRVFNNTADTPTESAIKINHGFQSEGVVPRDNLFFNNIFYRPASYLRVAYSSDALPQHFVDFGQYNRNCIFDETQFGDGTTGSLLELLTRANWQTIHGQDVDSISADPQFVDRLNNDYHLQSGSPAESSGRDTLGQFGTVGAAIPLGAYVTGSETIGVPA